MDWLPRIGLLLFFYDMETEPWGFDPEDRGGWSVIHVPDSSVIRGNAPEPAGLDEWRIRRRSVRFESVNASIVRGG